jgi:LacI family transcriptional regulator
VAVTVCSAVETFPGLTAFVCYTDYMALEVVKCLEGKKLKVPDDVSVIGYGNALPMPEFMRIPLTTVDQSVVRMGEEAFKMLFSMINGKAAGKAVEVPTQLIARASSGKVKRK